VHAYTVPHTQRIRPRTPTPFSTDEETRAYVVGSGRPSSRTAAVETDRARRLGRPNPDVWLGVKLFYRRVGFARASAMSFIQYDSARGDVCSPSNHVIPPTRDFRHQQHGAAMDTILSYGSDGRPESAYSGLKPTTFVDRLSAYTPMSTTTSGFVGSEPTSGLPYPFYNFDAMHAASNRSAEVDFRAITSSNGYTMSSEMGSAGGGLHRYAADCRPGAMSTSTTGFLSPDRTPYVNGGTALPVSLNSAVGQQMSPPSATTPTSPTAVVYPWMTIVGQYCHFCMSTSVSFRYGLILVTGIAKGGNSPSQNAPKTQF